MKARKIAYQMTFSREVGIDAGIIEPTPEEAAEMVESSRLYDLERKKRVLMLEGFWGQVFGITEPAIRAVVKLHALTYRSEFGDAECAHCLDGGDMGDHAYWPCETVRAIANVYGIGVPE